LLGCSVDSHQRQSMVRCSIAASEAVFALLLAAGSRARETVFTTFRGNHLIRSCTLGNTEKIICGFPGIEESKCTAMGCCFSSSQSSVWPQCFQAKKHEESCSLPAGEVSDCGMQTTFQDPFGLSCKSQGCCFVSNGPNKSAMCLKRRPKPTLPLPLAAPTCKVPETQRRACGRQEVTPKQCLDRGCCYYKTYVPGSVAPWCYFAGWETGSPSVATVQHPPISHARISQGVGDVHGLSTGATGLVASTSAVMVTTGPISTAEKPGSSQKPFEEATRSTTSFVDTVDQASDSERTATSTGSLKISRAAGDVSTSKLGTSTSVALRGQNVAKSVDDKASSTTAEHTVVFRTHKMTTTTGRYAVMGANNTHIGTSTEAPLSSTTVLTSNTAYSEAPIRPSAKVTASVTASVATTTTTTTCMAAGSKPLLWVQSAITNSTSTTSTTAAENASLTSNDILVLIPDFNDKQVMRPLLVLASLSAVAVSTVLAFAILFRFCRSSSAIQSELCDPSDPVQDTYPGYADYSLAQQEFQQSRDERDERDHYQVGKHR